MLAMHLINRTLEIDKMIDFNNYVPTIKDRGDEWINEHGHTMTWYPDVGCYLMTKFNKDCYKNLPDPGMDKVFENLEISREKPLTLSNLLSIMNPEVK